MTACSYQARSERETNRTLRRLRYEVHLAANALRDHEILGAYPGTETARETLIEEFQGASRRLFHLLVHLYGVDHLEEARRGYFSGMPERRSLAVEVVDNFADREIKSLVLPIFERTSFKHKLDVLRPFAQFEEPAPTLWQNLARIALREPSELSSFTRAVFLFELGRHEADGDTAEIANRIRFFLNDGNVAVREAAAAALETMQGRTGAKHATYD